METLQISTLNEMIALIESLNQEPDAMMRTFIDTVRGLPYGCSCNRGTRKNQAIRGYHLVAQNLNEQQKLKIKQVNNVKKVSIFFNGDLINEF